MIQDVIDELVSDGFKVSKRRFLFDTVYCVYRKGIINSYLNTEELLAWYEGYIIGSKVN